MNDEEIMEIHRQESEGGNTVAAIVSIIFFIVVIWALWWLSGTVEESPPTSAAPTSSVRISLPDPPPSTLPVIASAPAVRMTPIETTSTLPIFADDCAEMSYYRSWVGLPEIFDRIGYRETRCIQRDDVRTFCCYGWWQNYIASHLSDQSSYRDRIISDCAVTSYRDVNSATPEDKWRQACVTFVVYAIERELGRSGLGPWKATS